ncbi:YbhB/YbcL family Raf kinase inhibitor-like protein [Paramixta manurensis]|uniref:YbhB/YbcL family Raf kinase inhibitor-like protein n=1 Tax=Paramixta manurensis TaxID=2740817 RepID=A0A6M8UNT6_9GAMM|nr:YbhB/YbcL family Raf kinase inhibitor-like protein [Erwiniaceae bacterium PD-1]
MKKAMLCAALLAASFPLLAQEVFTLRSPDFTDNALLNKKFAGSTPGNASCTGENISPALSWQAVPDGTKSFALLVFDPEGAKGLGVSHLVAYNISAQQTHFEQGALSAGKGFTGGKNSSGTLSYHGPCPPAGTGPHHYVFTLIASELAADALPQGLTREALLQRLKGHTLGGAGLIGRFGN